MQCDVQHFTRVHCMRKRDVWSVLSTLVTKYWELIAKSWALLLCPSSGSTQPLFQFGTAVVFARRRRGRKPSRRRPVRARGGDKAARSVGGSHSVRKPISTTTGAERRWPWRNPVARHLPGHHSPAVRCAPGLVFLWGAVPREGRLTVPIGGQGE